MAPITRHQAYIERPLLWIKNKQKDMEICINHASAYVRFVRKKGHGHCEFLSRITIPRLKRINLSTAL